MFVYVHRSEFAYSLSLNDVCVWHMSCGTLEMNMKGRMVGHKREVTQVCTGELVCNSTHNGAS